MTDIIKSMRRGKTPHQTVIQEAMRPASKGFTPMTTRQGPQSEETGVRADSEGTVAPAKAHSLTHTVLRYTLYV